MIKLNFDINDLISNGKITHEEKGLISVLYLGSLYWVGFEIELDVIPDYDDMCGDCFFVDNVSSSISALTNEHGEDIYLNESEWGDLLSWVESYIVNNHCIEYKR